MTDFIKSKLLKSAKKALSEKTQIISFHGESVEIPVKYKDATALYLLFTAPYDKIKSLLPLDKIKPVKFSGNKAFFEITIFDYKDCPVGPYGEHTFSIPVIKKGAMQVPILPLIATSLFKTGHYVTLMGVSNSVSREHIEKIYPYPLFEKDLMMSISEDSQIDKVIAKIALDGQDLISVEAFRPKKFNFTHKKVNTMFADINKDNLFNVVLNVFAYEGRILSRKINPIKFSNDSFFGKIFSGIELDPHPILGIYYKHAVEVANAPKVV